MIPRDRAIDGIDQTALLLKGKLHGRQDYEHVYQNEVLSAIVKRGWKMHMPTPGVRNQLGKDKPFGVREMKHRSIVFALLLSTACVAEAQDSGQWDWTIAPYLWASDVSLNLTVRDDTTIGGDAAFRDLLDKVDSVFMGHFEGRRGHWGLYLDTIYLDLSDSKTVAVGPGGPILGDLMADAGMKMKLFDAGGLYRLSEPEADVQFDLLAGVRYIDVDVDATLTLPGPAMTTFNITTGPSETDVMLGARLIGRFADRWHWGLRGDLSFGGTEGTYNGLASVGYTFGESRLFTLTAGYRYMSIDIEGMNQRGTPTEAEVTMSGPILGFIFNF